MEAEILRDERAARANGEEGGRLCVQLFETFDSADIVFSV